MKKIKSRESDIVHRRDRTVDILRGLPVFTMVAANMAGSVLAAPHPFWLRFYGSFAAPLFILLSGMMVVLTARTKGHGWKYFLLRGAMIIGVGVLIDLQWKVYPFTTVDILYLIGISLPLASLSLNLKILPRWITVALIFSLTPLLQKILGYTSYPTEFYLWGEPTIVVENQTGLLNHWIVDGWFPIFPWLGFSLLGVNLANLRWKFQESATFGKKHILIMGFITLALGSVIWWLYPGRLLIREESSELFYPPTIGYIITAVGLILTLFFIVDWKSSLFIYKPLRVLSESSLFMYVIHLPLIEYVISPIWSEQNVHTFLLIYIGLLLFLMLIAYGLRVLKAKWKERPFIIHFLLGSY